MNLADFESKIEKRILERGRGYFDNGLVDEGEELDSGQWSFRVSGSHEYAVRVKMKNGEITESSCTCPYDMGPVCKHEVAAYLALRDVLSSSQESTNDRAGKGGREEGKETVREKLQKVVSKLGESELREFIIEQALKNAELKRMLLSKYVLEYFGGENKKGEYKKMIREALRSGMKHGFIDYWGAGSAAAGVEELLREADSLLDRGSAEEAALLYEAALEEVVPALGYTDDSNGELGGIIEGSFEKLRECAEKMRGFDAGKRFFKYCLRASRSDTYDGWSEWRWECLEIALQMASDEQERRELENGIHALIPKKSKEDSFSDEYDRECAAKLMLEVVRKWDGKKAAEKFLFEHLEHNSMRKKALENLVKKKRYEDAKKIAEDGVMLDGKKGYLGLVIDWLVWLLQISQAEKNTESVRKYAREIFLKGRNDFAYYDIFKKTFSQKEWPEKCDALIQDMKKNGGSMHALCEIFIREERWENLFQAVKENPSADMLDSYSSHLKERYPQELTAMYERIIRKNLEMVGGRGVYQDACKMLRKMKEMGAKEKVEDLVREFREMYRKRPALLEELGKV